MDPNKILILLMIVGQVLKIAEQLIDITNKTK